MIHRLDTSFHECFPLNRPSLMRILQLSEETGGDLTPDLIRRRTALGANYVKAMPRYARGCGLLAFSSYQLTPFGRIACQRDPGLDAAATQWLMHYHLSAALGPGPAFWHFLVTERFRLSEELRAAALGQDVAALAERQSGKSLKERTTRQAVTAFLGSYTRPDALGKLGFLAESVEGGYRVQRPAPPPVRAFAYILAEAWDSTYQSRATVNLEELWERNGLCDVLMLGRDELDLLLKELQRLGFLEVHRTVPPYQVVRLWQDKSALLGSLYE